MIKQVFAVMALVAFAGMPVAQAQDSKAAQPKAPRLPRGAGRARHCGCRQGTLSRRPTSTTC